MTTTTGNLSHPGAQRIFACLTVLLMLIQGCGTLKSYTPPSAALED